MKYYYSFIFISFFLFISVNIYCQKLEISGTVFEDFNNNKVQDYGEKGVQNVVVSDQHNTTITDENGDFKLQSNHDFPYIFISQPSGYLGKFYTLKSSEVNFPIQKTEIQKHFKFIHASDTHIDSLNLSRMGRFRKLSDSIGVDFIIISGDLIRDALRVNEATARNYYEMYLNEIEKFKIPVYSGMGNHEIFGIERDKSMISKNHPLYGKNMYRYFLGPNYYSFNYGGIHFIAIDAVNYQDLYYYGGVDSVQLNWLEGDLKYVPLNIPIVTFNHIPFVSQGFSFMGFDNDIFFGPQLLLQDGHLEHRHIVHNFNEVQKIIGNRPFPLALSGHYHAAQESVIIHSNTKFAQTSAITRPDKLVYNGFSIRSGFTLYEVKDGKVVSSEFISLNFFN